MSENRYQSDEELHVGDVITKLTDRLITATRERDEVMRERDNLQRDIKQTRLDRIAATQAADKLQDQLNELRDDLAYARKIIALIQQSMDSQRHAEKLMAVRNV